MKRKMQAVRVTEMKATPWEIKEQRSSTMRAVKGQDTKPELLVRKMVFAAGYRFRLHRKELPGSPDLVFASRRKVIFVNGCFWHGHDCKRGARQPKQNVEYWKAKIARNVMRDRDVLKRLKALDWDAMVVWECHLKNDTETLQEIEKFLSS